MRHRAAFFILAVVTGLATPYLSATSVVPIQGERPTENALDALLERIRLVAAADEWQKPGWRDDVLESGVVKLYEQLQRAAKKDPLTLPVGFREVRPRKPNVEGRELPFLSNELHIAKHVVVSHAKRSILLADGNLRVSFAHDCIIIARGAVSIAHGSGNFVAAGHYVHTSHDGNAPPDGKRERPAGSLLLSGAVLDVSHAKGSICMAPQAVRISFAAEVTFMNSPNVEVSHEKNCTRLGDAKTPLASGPRKNPLAGKFKITQLVKPNDAGQGALVVLERNGIESVVRLGAEIADGQGKTISALAGWKLSFVGEDFALFSKGHEDAGFYLRSPR